jgi:imidazolonepropionase-like amidohydrolase
MDVIKRWKASAAAGDWPLIVASGHILEAPNPDLPRATIVANPEQARHVVDSLRETGADFIKIYQRLSRDTYLAVMAEAKRIGTYVAGHVPYPVTVAEASDLGQRTIEHLTYVASDCSTEADALRAERVAMLDDTSKTRMPDYLSQGPRIIAGYDPARCRALTARLARNRTWQVPTLVVSRSYAYLDDERFTADPRMRYMPDDFATKVGNWHSNPRLRALTPADWANNKRVHDDDLKIVGELYRAGVPIMAGTDVLNPFAFPGFSLHDELVLLVRAGFSNADALRAATLNPAVFLNATDSLGTVARNKRADLVLLDADPLADISNTQKVRAVVLKGRYFGRAALDSMLAAAERRAHAK